MASLKVKRLKQETVENRKLWETGNCGKQARGVGVDLEEEFLSSKPAASLGRVGEGLPPSLARLAPPPIKGGAGLLLETHKFLPLISGLEPFWFRASNCFSQRFRAF